MPNKNEKPQPVNQKIKPQEIKVSTDVLEPINDILRRPTPGTATKTFSH